MRERRQGPVSMTEAQATRKQPREQRQGTDNGHRAPKQSFPALRTRPRKLLFKLAKQKKDFETRWIQTDKN